MAAQYPSPDSTKQGESNNLAIKRHAARFRRAACVDMDNLVFIDYRGAPPPQPSQSHQLRVGEIFLS
jgi:hypothetical protein